MSQKRTEPAKVVGLRLSIDLAKDLAVYAANEGRRMNEIAENALREYLAKQKEAV